MSFSLAPHPIGIKYWTNLWKEVKDKPYSEVHANFQNWYYQTFRGRFGRYYYRHRAGPMGAFAPIVVGCFVFKVGAMYYGALRDSSAAVEAGKAYGQGGYKCNPVPK